MGSYMREREKERAVRGVASVSLDGSGSLKYNWMEWENLVKRRKCILFAIIMAVSLGVGQNRKCKGNKIAEAKFCQSSSKIFGSK